MSAKIANFCYNVRGRFCQDTVQAERVQQMKKDPRKYVPMQYLNLETTNEKGSVWEVNTIHFRLHHPAEPFQAEPSLNPFN